MESTETVQPRSSSAWPGPPGATRSRRQVAREELGLEQLHLAARGGAGLEEFYGRFGWRESGRRPGVLRFGPGDDRDEVLMHLAPL
ncbi:hypothetical protein HX747_15930 [Streptomyces sp. L06]|nr:hypothetical protein [Streptomyces sp. L06]